MVLGGKLKNWGFSLKIFVFSPKYMWQTKYIIRMANEESIKILSFITPGTGGSCVRRGWHFQKHLLYFGDGSDKHKKTVLTMCLLIPITKTAYIAAFLCHCWFLFIYGGAVDLTRSQYTVSDTQVTGKTHGPSSCLFAVLDFKNTPRIHNCFSRQTKL